MRHWFFTIQRAPKRATISDADALVVLQAHTAYFKRLGQEGKCLLAGPFMDYLNCELGSGCYVFAAESEAVAKQMADVDPLVTEGLYSYKMWEWTKVVPE